MGTGQVAVATGSKRHPELALGTVPQRPLNSRDSSVGRGDALLGLRARVERVPMQPEEYGTRRDETIDRSTCSASGAVLPWFPYSSTLVRALIPCDPVRPLVNPNHYGSYFGRPAIRSNRSQDRRALA